MSLFSTMVVIGSKLQSGREGKEEVKGKLTILVFSSTLWQNHPRVRERPDDAVEDTSSRTISSKHQTIPVRTSFPNGVDDSTRRKEAEEKRN